MITVFIRCWFVGIKWSGKRDSNSRLPPWQGGALPTELFPLCLLCFKQERNSNEVRLGVKPNHAYRLNYLQYSPKNSLIDQKKRKYWLAIYLSWKIIRAQSTTTKGGDQWYLLQVSRDNLLSCSSHTSNEGRFLTGPFYFQIVISRQMSKEAFPKQLLQDGHSVILLPKVVNAYSASFFS